jgi:type VI secretion system secreted protein VgrG
LAIINVKVSKFDNNSFVKEDYGKFLVIGIEHYITENGKYHNSFEAIPSGLEVIPVNNVITPIAEPQIATVKDNKDPDKLGRVRAQMLWQKGDEMTDWLRVMTPDAGGGKGGAKNRGLVVVPESGDQVLICFRYNDPDRPFIMGSMFHGKSAGGGGDGNKSKTLTSLSGSVVSLDGDAISIVDAKGNQIHFDGTGKIDVSSSESITLSCGSSVIELKKDGSIDISGKAISIGGKTVDLSGSDSASMSSGPASFSAEKSGDANVNGTKANVNASAEATLNAGATTTVSAGGKVAIQGAIVALN